MKSTLYLKFIIIYIIFGFLSFFTVGILTSQLMLDRLEKNDSQNLYKQANVMAADYLPSYFQEDNSTRAVHSQLNAAKQYLNSSLWFVKEDGTLITSANLENTAAPDMIENFDPAEIGSDQYIIGDYHGYFKEDVITVMAPVTQGFYIRGYLLIHKPVSYIQQTSSRMMFPVYITVAVIFILSFILLLAFHFFIYRPLRQITEAATQYASGNLTYEIPVNTHDEMGYLSASLNYISVEDRDMEE